VANINYAPLLCFFSCYVDHRDLHSFPTRRSSDLYRNTAYHAYQNIPIYKYHKSETFNYLHRPVSQYSRCNGLHKNKQLTRKTMRSEEHTSELQSRENLVCRLLLEKKKTPRKI